MHVPFVDLVSQYKSIKPEIDAAIQGCLDTASFIGGKPVKDFEIGFASYVGTKHCISCANGTDSIEILLKAMGIGAGDEVIVPALTWISTAEAVSSVGATPVFVDIRPDYFTIDTTKIEAKITSRTKVIIPVHLYGLPAEMDEVMAVAKKYNLKVMEDCAQAHGATYKGKKVGTFGEVASFSFYPGKNLGAYGDAGGMVTKNDDIAIKARMIGEHGQLKKHDHQIEGRNSRLDAIQAAILSVKLKYLDKWTAQRNQAASWYRKYLKGVELPQTPSHSSHVFHLFVVKVHDRENLMKRLEGRGIGCGIHYPKALPFLKAYERFNEKPSDFPAAARIQDRILSLPMFPELNEEMIAYVAEAINQFVNEGETKIAV